MWRVLLQRKQKFSKAKRIKFEANIAIFDLLKRRIRGFQA